MFKLTLFLLSPCTLVNADHYITTIVECVFVNHSWSSMFATKK